MLSSNHNLGNIVGPVRYCMVCVHQVGFYVGCFSVVYCIYFFVFKLPLARPGFGGKLSHRAEDGVSFPRSEVVVFRLYLYRMDLVLILQSCPLDDA